MALATAMAAVLLPSSPAGAEFVHQQDVVASKFAVEPAVPRADETPRSHEHLSEQELPPCV
jgi:hypothetical protein